MFEDQSSDDEDLVVRGPSESCWVHEGCEVRLLKIADLGIRRLYIVSMYQSTMLGIEPYKLRRVVALEAAWIIRKSQRFFWSMYFPFSLLGGYNIRGEFGIPLDVDQLAGATGSPTCVPALLFWRNP